MAQSALWRVGTAQHPPTLLSPARLAETVGSTLGLNDGRPYVRLRAGQGWPLPPDGRVSRAVDYADWPVAKQQLHSRLHSVRVRLGAELWLAR